MKLFFMLSRIFIFLILCVPSAVWAQPQDQVKPIDNQDCFSCHSDPESKTFVDSAKFQTSIHGTASCIDCHSDIKDISHAPSLAKVNCGTCHAEEHEAMVKSDHGKALMAGTDDAKACLSCHGPAHTILAFGDKADPLVKIRISQACGTCHDKHLKTFNSTVHGQAVTSGKTSAPTCGDCHGVHEINKYTNPTSKLFWQNIPATCGGCHAEVMKVFNNSIHGKSVVANKREAPVCHDCHGEHSIKVAHGADSMVSPAHITDTCGQCHAAERITTKYQLPNFVVNTYMESYHGLSIQRGSVTAANCASCHNTHDILPSTDPKSSINPANLVKTCGQCHAGIGQKVLQGKIHSGSKPELADNLTNMVRNFYLVLIALVVGMMLLHNLLDLAKKMRAHYRHMASLEKPIRMERSERIQHVILVVSFISLAYTGFALKFPHAWWTIPFMGTEDWRALGHRIAALSFIVLSGYHLWFMIFTTKGRWHLNQLRPRMIDLIQFGQTFSYYFGKRKEKPCPAFYGYIEKMEYWALVWGSVIMVATGGILLYKEWFLRFLPKGVLDAVATAHYYEAVLACLAIIIWHWYFVIFDPDVYPMKWTWLNGKSAPADDERTT
ncbi:MAG: cytochrome b/b6 domain-containing protein [Candidatus Omnitrophica bacterium]|nr:cytochrome b/b6 domain-containing protein [Candidatus Omnitrophota bacterium]